MCPEQRWTSEYQNYFSVILFFFKWAIPGRFFLYFRLFNTVDSEYMNQILPMTGFETWTSDVGSNRSTNWVIATARSFFSLASIHSLCLNPPYGEKLLQIKP